jgi:hypothetical protein
MSLTYGFKSARDMLAKLQREHARLNTEVSSDNFFNFVVTAYHIIDWVEKDPSVSASAKDDLSTMRKNIYLAACRDVANASKHFVLDYKNQITAKTSVTRGFSFIPVTSPLLMLRRGRLSIVVELNDGQRFEGLQFAQEVVTAWEAFFAKHSL